MSITLKEINRLAVPAVFAGIIEPVISITDTMVAGDLNRLNQNNLPYLGAIGLSGALLSAFVWIFAQTRSALSSYVAINYGKNKLDYIQPLVAQTFYMNLFLGLMLAGIVYFFTRPIFALQNADGILLDLTAHYFQIRVWGFPLTLLTFTLFGAFRGYQNTRWAMNIALMGGVTNIILDLVFVYFFHWDIKGIAYASLIAQGIMLIGAMYILLQKTPFSLSPGIQIHPDFKGLVWMSIHLFIRTLSLNIALWFANKFATSYGDDYISIQSVLIQIWLLSAFLLDGYSTAGNALSGRLIGQEEYNNLKLLSQHLLKIMLLLSGIIMLTMLVFYPYIGLIFTHNPTVLSLFKQYFWVVVLMQPINAVAFLFDGIFKGMGEARKLRNVLLIATFAGFLPTLYFTDALGLKFYSIWIALFIWMLIRSFGLFIIFRQKYYNGNTLCKH